MRCIDKIRNYVISARDSGHLKPGDKLPSYHEMAKSFQSSYPTVSAAINALAREGLVSVQHGNGTFLAGGDWLDVAVYCQASTLAPDRLDALLQRHLDGTNLNIRVRTHPAEGLAAPGGVRAATERSVAALSLLGGDGIEEELPPAYLPQFADYEEVMATLHRIPGQKYDYGLPFCHCTYQMGVNRALLERVGVRAAELTHDLRWWPAFSKRCRNLGILPMTVDYYGLSALYFDAFFPALWAVSPSFQERAQTAAPLFDTPEGHRWLAMVRDTGLIRDHWNDPDSFFQNGAALTPLLGSWIAVQNRATDRSDKRVDELDVVPYREDGGRRIVFTGSTNFLKAYWRHDISIADRGRIWEMVKLLSSPAFQKEFCDVTGFISACRGLDGHEYAWNPGGRWNDFIPRANEAVCRQMTFFGYSRRVMFSVLMEQMTRFGVDVADTARRMDEKKLPFPHDFSHTGYQRGAADSRPAKAKEMV